MYIQLVDENYKKPNLCAGCGEKEAEVEESLCKDCSDKIKEHKKW